MDSLAAQQYPGHGFDASWDLNKKDVVEAERLGFDSTLVAQHTINPNGDEFVELEARTGSTLSRKEHLNGYPIAMFVSAWS